MEKAMQPTPVLLAGESHGWRSVAGYSPWGREESDTTEPLHFTSVHPQAFHLYSSEYGLLKWFLKNSLFSSF